MVKDILDKDGNVIGQATFPDDATDAQITLALQPYTQIPTIPSVTARQFRQALVLMGISTDTIEAALNSLPEPTKSLATIEWQYSNAFERNRPLVIEVGQMLGYTSDQLDAIWELAASLP